MWPIHLGNGAQHPEGPTASAGAAPSVLTSLGLVSLDGSASTDPLGAGLTYAWTMDIKPATSAAVLVDETTSTPDFTTDKAGTYSGLLTVTDGRGATDTIRWVREVRSAFSLALTAVADSPDLATAALIATPSGAIGTVTYVWTLLGPDETSQTTLIADATAASTTAVLASIASGQRAGLWTAQCVATDAAGQAVTKTVQWKVGAKVTTGAGLIWYYRALRLDWTLEATADWTGSDGVHSIQGVDVTSRNGANADALGPVLNEGLLMQPKANFFFTAADRTSCILDYGLAAVLTGWTIGTPVCIQNVYEWVTPPAANDAAVRLFICTETPVTTSGEHLFHAFDGFASGAVQGGVSRIIDVTGASYATAIGPFTGLELLLSGHGVSAGRVTADPGTAVVNPGTWTRYPMSASDSGERPWNTVAPGTAQETSANVRTGMATHRTTTGTAIALYWRHSDIWLAA